MLFKNSLKFTNQDLKLLIHCIMSMILVSIKHYIYFLTNLPIRVLLNPARISNTILFNCFPLTSSKTILYVQKHYELRYKKNDVLIGKELCLQFA